MSETTESGRQFVPTYFDVLDSKLYRSIPGDPLKLYNILRRYVCRARSGHSLSLFFIQGYLAVSGYLGTYASIFGKSEATISRWLKTLERHKVLTTYRKGREGVPSIWILGRVIHVEGSDYGTDVFFLDHLATAQERDGETAEAFDKTAMEECESPEHAKLNSTLALLQVRVQARMQGSNREEVIEKNNTTALATPTLEEEEEENPKPPPAEETFEEKYLVTLHYKDEDVRVLGNRTKGPWSIECIDCGNSVTIDQPSTAVECNCGMHEYQIVKTKIEKPVEVAHGPVEAYLLIAGRKRHTIAQEWLDEIEATVTDINFWRQVVKEYCGQGWNRGNISKMLEYYKEGRLPGTRKKKEEVSEPKVQKVDGKQVLVYDDEKKGHGPKRKKVDGKVVLTYD